MKLFREYCKELTYFESTNKSIATTRNEIHKRKGMFFRFILDIIILLLVASIPGYLIYLLNYSGVTGGLQALNFIGVVFSILGLILFFSLDWIQRCSTYFQESTHLNNENIGNGIVNVYFWLSKYEKRKGRFEITKSRITTRRYLNDLAKNSLDLNASEVIVLNGLIEKDNIVRKQYIENITIEEEFDILTN